jgi:hypothetical protein
VVTVGQSAPFDVLALQGVRVFFTSAVLPDTDLILGQHGVLDRVVFHQYNQASDRRFVVRLP